MNNKGFNEKAFTEWLEEKYDLNSYAVEMVTNIIEYANKWEHVSKDQLAYFISDLLPEVEFEEVAQFCEDSILTDGTLRALGRNKEENIMRATGIIRRIDDLGRVVIPKSVRERTGLMEAGTPVEFSTSNNLVVLQRYDPQAVDTEI